MRVRSTWQRFSGRLAGSAASLLKASFENAGPACSMWTPHASGRLIATSTAASPANLGVTIVAPSLYAPDPIDNAIRNMAAVLAPMVRCSARRPRACPAAWMNASAVPARAGRPSAAKSACGGPDAGQRCALPRSGPRPGLSRGRGAHCPGGQPVAFTLQQAARRALARMQDNQLFAASSYLVGMNLLATQHDSALIGRSAIFAPQELTPRFKWCAGRDGQPGQRRRDHRRMGFSGAQTTLGNE